MRIQCGNYAAVKLLVHEAIALAKEKGALNWTAYEIMTSGLLKVLAGEASGTVSTITTASQSGGHWVGLRASAAMSMAWLWRDHGKRHEARELLAPVYGWFTEGFDTLDLKEAKALLEELAA
jgi:predicted ATPase